MPPSRKRNPVSFLAITFGASALAGVFGLPGFVRQIELRTYDLRVVATARPASTQKNIAIVEINDDSIQRMEPLVGRWPWPRLVHAQLIDYLAAGGAKVIVYDVLFAEHDRHKFMVGDSEWSGEESDRALVDATRKAGNVVHAVEASSAELIATTTSTAPADGCVEHRPAMTPPFEELADAAKGIGHTFFAIDADGPLRRTSPLVDVNGREIPSLALVATLMAEGLKIDDAACSGDVIADWRIRGAAGAGTDR